MLGPVVGGPLYDVFGYFLSFACFAAMLFISLIVAFIITPKALNDSNEEEGI